MGKRPTDQSLMEWIETRRVFRDSGLREDEFAGREAEMRYYLGHSIGRFRETLRLVEPLACACPEPELLELGADPYFLTGALVERLGCRVVAASSHDERWPGPPRADRERDFLYLQTPRAVHPIEVWRFNVERDPFPFSDARFDIVLCNEIVEHLCFSPTQMLVEIHRVLKPGGHLLLTTENACRLKNLVLQCLNRNTADQFSGYGVYGRHNREFTLPELRDLVAGCGYRIADSRLVNWYGEGGRKHDLLATALRFLTALPGLTAKKQHLYVVAQSTQSRNEYYPSWLYRSRYPSVREGQALAGR